MTVQEGSKWQCDIFLGICMIIRNLGLFLFSHTNKYSALFYIFIVAPCCGCSCFRVLVCSEKQAIQMHVQQINKPDVYLFASGLPGRACPSTRSPAVRSCVPKQSPSAEPGRHTPLPHTGERTAWVYHIGTTGPIVSPFWCVFFVGVGWKGLQLLQLWVWHSRHSK